MKAKTLTLLLLLSLALNISANEILGGFGLLLGERITVGGEIPKDGRRNYITPGKTMNEFSKYWVILTPSKGEIAEIGATGKYQVVKRFDEDTRASLLLGSHYSCNVSFDRLFSVLHKKYVAHPSEDNLLARLADFAKYDRDVFSRIYGDNLYAHISVEDREVRLECDTKTGELSIKYWDHSLKVRVNNESIDRVEHAL